MGTATRKLSEGATKPSWLVRNEQGETFGPVDFETLKAWACDGRLAPTNEISESGAGWQLATAVRALEMNWVAEVTPGTFYGPIHKRAMEELVRDGSIVSAGAFFARRSLDGKAESAADEAQAERVRALTEQYARTQQELADTESQLREARRAAAERDEQAHEAQRQISECEAQAHAARKTAAELQAQLQQARDLAEQARQQAEAGERQLRARLAEHEAQAQRRVAAYEEQVRLAQQQAAACAQQMEQAGRQAAAAEARLRATEQQLSEQAEQARAAQQQWVSKADGLAADLEALRKTHAELVAKAAEMSAERAAERVAREARERGLESEREALSASLAQARSESDAQKSRLARLEAERLGAAAAASAQGGLDARLRTASAELAGAQQELASEKAAARQAEARCAALEEALQAARAKDGEKAAFSDGVAAELRLMREQIEALGALLRRPGAASEPAAQGASRPSGRVYVEAEPVEVLPPEGRSKDTRAPAAEPSQAAAGATGKRADPPKNANGGRAGPGLSLADLEQQARRELERLGAQGANLFKRNK